MRLRVVRTRTELAELAPAWNDLWQRSAATLPTLRAEALDAWLVHFAPQARLRFLAVEADGRLVAALPLLGRRLGGVVRVGGFPDNPWTPGCDLLLDESHAATADAALGELAESVRRLSWACVWLHGLPLEAPRWERFADALRRAGAAVSAKAHYEVGRQPIELDWEAYRRRWSRKHRSNLQRAFRRFEEHGARFAWEPVAPTSVAPLLREAFSVEDRSWKGAGGTSVLRSPGVLPFLAAQSERLAAGAFVSCGLLRTGVGDPVAFVFGWTAKGVRHAFKIGYDERFAACSPGQVLLHEALRTWFAEPEATSWDWVGPTTPAVACWQPTSYRIGRWAISTRSLAGRTALAALDQLWPRVRSWLRRGATPAPSDSERVAAATP